MTVAGHLVAVSTDRFGATLTSDVAIGDTVLQLDSTIFFDEQFGGSVLINGTKLDYQAFDDPTADSDDDPDGDGPTTLTLTAASPVAADAGDRAWAFDPTTGSDDPVTEHVALVTIDDRDGGTALPARIRAGIADQLLSDYETYLGKAVELEVIDGELVLVDILGSKSTGDLKFMQDETEAAGAGGTVTLELTYIPVENSEHLYIGGVYQRGANWSRDRWTVTVPDPGSNLRRGNKVAMEYAYRDPAPKPAPDYSGPTWHARNGMWSAFPTSFLTSLPLPTGTQIGDLLVVVAFGEGDSGNPAITDPRMTTMTPIVPNMHIALGYATDLTDLTCHVGGVNLPIDQFAGVEILAVRGTGDGVAYDPTRLTTAEVPAHGLLNTIAGAGHGAILAVVSGVANTISLDMATYCPEFTDWGGTAHTAVLGNFGYAASGSPPAQHSPTNATTFAAVIGLK